MHPAGKNYAVVQEIHSTKLTELHKALGPVGSRFIERYGETLTERGLNVALTAENIDAFVSAPNFYEAVKHIRLQDIVITYLRDTISTRDSDLRQAFRSIAQKTASTLEAELDKALGQLREEREVLPRLLEEMRSLKA